MKLSDIDFTVRREVLVLVEAKDPKYMPKKAHTNDAGADLTSAEDVTLLPGETALVPLGFKCAIPDGYEMQVRPRSGLSLRTGLRIANSPGTIDAGFRDEVCAIVTNAGRAIERIHEGDRIAQAVVARVPSVKFMPWEDVSGVGRNRGGGWGSTGVSEPLEDTDE